MQKASKKGTLAGLKHTDIETVLQGMKAQVAQALPKDVSAERVIQMTTTLISQNPQIAQCSAQSIVGAMMQASMLGFKPVSALGQCYFVPYGGHVQFQIGYKGWIDLARRSGQIKNLYAYCVREGDEFSYKLGLQPELNHTPKVGPDAMMTHVYAVAHYKDGGYDFIVLTRAEVESLRMRNAMQKAAPAGPWKSDYEAMAKAKAIKQLAKFMPLSDEMQQASVSDDGIIDVTKAATSDHSGVNLDAIEYETDFAESEDVTEVNDPTDEN